MSRLPVSTAAQSQILSLHPLCDSDTCFCQPPTVLQACAGGSDKVSELPLAELPPAAGPSTRDCTPSRQRIGGLLPGTPQTAPPSTGNMAQQMLSPPPKRLATAVRAPAGTALMSPPPARTRANKKLVMGAIEGAAAGTPALLVVAGRKHQPQAGRSRTLFVVSLHALC